MANRRMERLRQKWEEAGIPPPPKPRPARKRAGKRRKRLTFPETPIGAYLANMAPLEYKMIAGHLPPCALPSADLIEQVGYSTNSPAFRLPYFRKLLLDYRVNGGYTKKTLKDLSASEMLRFIELKNETKEK